MTLVFVDIEQSNPSLFKEKTEPLQLGLVVYDIPTSTVLGEIEINLKLEETYLDDFISDFTGIPKNYKGHYFDQIARYLLKKGLKKYTPVCWGDDVRWLNDYCIRKGIQPFLNNRYIDFSLLFQILHTEDTKTKQKTMSQENACILKNVRVEYPLHNALNDAKTLYNLYRGTLNV